MARDPVFETLLTPTAAPATDGAVLASAPPVRPMGTRVRAGNAMSRTRSAVLDGARIAVQESGTRITMAQVAAAAGVAKATLYNHFRTRDAILGALLEDELSTLVGAVRDLPLADALVAAARAVADNPMLRALAAREPATVARLAVIDAGSAGWRTAREAAGDVLAAAGRGGADMVLRWLASFLTTPTSAVAIAADVDVLLSGLPVAGMPADGPLAYTA
jgi:AcrR family transcriptional regulator